MKVAPASCTRASESEPDSLNTIRMTSVFLRKLSLNALKNWHQNSGAKRFVVMRLENIGGPSGRLRRLRYLDGTELGKARVVAAAHARASAAAPLAPRCPARA